MTRSIRMQNLYLKFIKYQHLRCLSSLILCEMNFSILVGHDIDQLPRDHDDFPNRFPIGMRFDILVR